MRPALVDPRIVRMMRWDKQFAAASLIALWLLYAFVFWQLAVVIGGYLPGFVIVCAFVGAGILFLNTMSIYAMIRRCSAVSEIARIYGPEIQCEEIEDCDPPNTWIA